jgi:ATP synthase protein I
VGKTSDNPEDRDAELKARLDKLSNALKTENKTIADAGMVGASTAANTQLSSAVGTGLKVGTELVAGVLVGGFLGWWIDHWFGTSPAFLLIMLFMGMVGGFWNIYRVAARPTGVGPAQKDTKSPPAN